MGWGGYGDGDGFREYVSVGQKLANAAKHAAQVAKKQGREPSPVKLDSKKIATTFWGKAWCDNLTAYSDYSNRLPRGATYVRNGSVVDLIIKPRNIEAIVAGSETYEIKIEIDALTKPIWRQIKQDCSATIDSLLDLLAGRFSDGVMQRLTQQKNGLFPSPREIKMKCSCPDWSDCCKHLAAVMYGIGARLDKQPELLFLLRDVDHQELVTQAVAEGNLDKELTGSADSSLAGQDLGAIFGIELDAPAEQPPMKSAARSPKAKAKAIPKAKAVAKTKASNSKTKTTAKAVSTVSAKNKRIIELAIALKSKTRRPVAAKISVAKTNATKKAATAKKTGAKPKKTVSALAAKPAVSKRAIKKLA